jgi:ribosomal RNA-processing protein 12
LLPQPHPSPLGHFVSYFVPLSERMFEYQSTAEMEDRPAEAKVWSVLIAQIWAGFVGYCYGSSDLPKVRNVCSDSGSTIISENGFHPSQALTAEFAQLLSQLLYGQPELRPAVLKALKVMVESNVALSKEDEDESARVGIISSAQAEQNVAFLKTQAESWLAVLFNVFGSVDRDSRAPVGDVIGAWASITAEKVR